MTEDDIASLKNELEQFQKEKDQIRTIIGSIGSKTSEAQDRVINIIFAVIILALFAVDSMRHVMGIEIPLPPLFSIEIGLVLVSAKIIWMIHKQMKVDHFQFWILNSIEFRINDISKRLLKIEQSVVSSGKP